MADLRIREVDQEKDSEWIRQLLLQNWGGDCIVSGGVMFCPQEMEGFIAEDNGIRVGILSYVIISDNEMEIVLIEALNKHQGIGSTLVDRAKNRAFVRNCSRVYLYTTNDNLDALRFYQRRGFKIVNIYTGAMTEARKMKPGIPLIGDYNIPMLDEIELEFRL